MQFPETNWTVLAQATMNGSPDGRAAMDELCRRYWKPVAACIAGKGAPPARVDDLTQDFFVQMLEKGAFRRADREKGRFRSYVLGSLRYFLADDVKRESSQKRGGHLDRESLNEDSAVAEVDAAYFDRAWARTLFEQVLASVEKDITEARGADGWGLLRRYLPGQQDPLPMAELARRLGMGEGGAKSEVFRLRQKFRETLRSAVAVTVGAPHEIDEELAHLRSALSA